MLAQALSRKSDTEILDSVQASLTQEGVPFVRRNLLKQDGRRFLVEKAGKGRGLIERIEKLVDELYVKVPANLATSWDVANWIVDQMLSLKRDPALKVLSRDYLLIAVLYWMHK